VRRVWSCGGLRGARRWLTAAGGVRLLRGGWLVAGRAPSYLGGARSFFGGAWRCEGGGPSVLLGEPSTWGGTPSVLLGASGSELGECTSLGRWRVRELGVCLKLLGSCPKKTGAPGSELGRCRKTRQRSGSTASALGRDVDMAFLLALLAARPIAAIAATRPIADPGKAFLDVATVEVARQVTAVRVTAPHIAVATLRGKRAHAWIKAPMGDTAQGQPAVEDAQTLEHAMAADGPVAELRATARARVLSVGAAKAFVG